ncbi:MAG: YlbF family regulator [Candidatus Aphodocola sp.]
MNDIKMKVDVLFDELEETRLYKDYIKIKKQLKEDKDINNLINEIRRYQKIATNNKDESVENKIKELYKKLESYPIYQSYLNIKEELESELYIIKENFELYFKELLKMNQ